MNKLIFEWNDTKSKTNVQKHGVSFEEAQTVFFDDNAIEFDDPDHSFEEERYLLLGFSQTLKVLVVCHCYRDDESIIRIRAPEIIKSTILLVFWPGVPFLLSGT